MRSPVHTTSALKIRGSMTFSLNGLGPPRRGGPPYPLRYCPSSHAREVEAEADDDESGGWSTRSCAPSGVGTNGSALNRSRLAPRQSAKRWGSIPSARRTHVKARHRVALLACMLACLVRISLGSGVGAQQCSFLTARTSTNLRNCARHMQQAYSITRSYDVGDVPCAHGVRQRHWCLCGAVAW